MADKNPLWPTTPRRRHRPLPPEFEVNNRWTLPVNHLFALIYRGKWVPHPDALVPYTPDMIQYARELQIYHERLRINEVAIQEHDVLLQLQLDRAREEELHATLMKMLEPTMRQEKIDELKDELTRFFKACLGALILLVGFIAVKENTPLIKMKVTVCIEGTMAAITFAFNAVYKVFHDVFLVLCHVDWDGVATFYHNLIRTPDFWGTLSIVILAIAIHSGFGSRAVGVAVAGRQGR